MSISEKEESLSKIEVRFHDSFFKDLDKLSNKDIEIFEKKKLKILENPKRQKYLHGAQHCYREPITDNIRVIYFIHKNILWFLTIGPHDKAYSKFRERLNQIKIKYGLE
jgi:mRNA-degrading endonuclease RelE of RelBE toxin-antitoxin system